MSVHTANPKFSFELPSMSYIDARWEEPNLRTPPVPPRVVRKRGLAAWLSHRLAAFLAWRQDSQSAAELSSMSDHELMDIGLTRADITRVFDKNLNADLQQRGKIG